MNAAEISGTFGPAEGGTLEKRVSINCLMRVFFNFYPSRPQIEILVTWCIVYSPYKIFK